MKDRSKVEPWPTMQDCKMLETEVYSTTEGWTEVTQLWQLDASLADQWRCWRRGVVVTGFWCCMLPGRTGADRWLRFLWVETDSHVWKHPARRIHLPLQLSRHLGRGVHLRSAAQDALLNPITWLSDKHICLLAGAFLLPWTVWVCKWQTGDPSRVYSRLSPTDHWRWQPPWRFSPLNTVY